MNNKLLFIVDIVIIIVSINCNKNEESVLIPEIPKDPKTYSWTLDTVSFTNTYQTWMYGIWGSSANDVYMVGLSDNKDKLYHYDGKDWSYIPLTSDWGGIVVGRFVLCDITGFSKNDIWVVGIHDYSSPVSYTSRLVLHYNGSGWQEMDLPAGEGLSCIWGSNSNNLFAAGLGKTVWHYDGKTWTKDSLPVTIQEGMEFSSFSIAGNSKGEVFIDALSHQNLPRNITYFFIYSNGKWTLKDSTIIDRERTEKRWGDGQFWVSKEGNLFSVGPVYKWNGNNWNIINSGLERAFCIYGTSEKNIFVAGIFGEIYHYNGSNWQQITQLFNQNITYYGIWCDDKEAFIMGHLNNKTVVLHGK
jgi:hypothetical protein